MQVTLGQIFMICIVLYALDKYLDYKAKSWIDYYLEVQGVQGSPPRRLEGFAPWPHPEQQSLGASDYYSAVAGVNGTPNIRSSLQPLYNAGPPALSLPQQQWNTHMQMEQEKQRAIQGPTHLFAANMEPQRAACPTFHPITSHDVPYTVSLHPKDGDFSHSCNIRPLGADIFPLGMSNGITQAQELSPQEIAKRNADGAFVDEYIRSLDDRTSTQASQDFLPYTAVW